MGGWVFPRDNGQPHKGDYVETHRISFAPIITLCGMMANKAGVTEIPIYNYGGLKTNLPLEIRIYEYRSTVRWEGLLFSNFKEDA